MAEKRGHREGRGGELASQGLGDRGEGGSAKPQEHGSHLQMNPGRTRRCQEKPPARGGRALTSLSWKGLERMVRLPSSMDFWNLAGVCRPCSLS